MLYVNCLSVKVTEKSKPKAMRDNDDHDDDVRYSSENQDSDSEMSIVKENSSDEEEYLDVEQTERRPGHKFSSDIELLKKYPSIRLSSLFSYLGIISLRLPISLNEIYQYPLLRPVFCEIDSSWIIEDKIPYTRADKLVPPHLFRQLHSRTQGRFQVNVPPHNLLANRRLNFNRPNCITGLDNYPFCTSDPTTFHSLR